MIRITDQETRLVVEQIFGESCGDLYKADSFTEWETVERHKQDVYETLWDAEQTFWDVYEMIQKGMFLEAAPEAFSDIGTADTPDNVRKIVTINKQMAYLGLPQVPKEAAQGLLANSMVSSNPKYYRYVGKGFYGALKDRHTGKEPTNWVKEIRYVRQGTPIPWIIDPETLKPIPRLGAVTNRPVKEGEAQVPPDWNEYAPRKARAFQDEQTGQPYHGVYIGYADHIKQLETKVGDRIRLTPGGKRNIKGTGEKLPIHSVERDAEGNPVYGPDGHPKKSSQIMGYIDRRNDRTINTRGTGIERGQIGADLSPPDPNNPDSYFGVPGDNLNDQPKVPPGARGYRPDASSNAIQKQWGQYKWYMMQNPQLFDQRLIKVLMAKQAQDRANWKRQNPKSKRNGVQFTPDPKRGYIPTETRPIQRPDARTTPYVDDAPQFGQARNYQYVDVPDEKNPGKTKKVLQSVPQDYYRRMVIPDPANPDRRILAHPETRDMTPEERLKRQLFFLQHVQRVEDEIHQNDEEVKAIEKRNKENGTDFLEDPEYKALRAERIELEKKYKGYKAQAQAYGKGTVTSPQQVKTGTYGNYRVPYTPEEEEEIRTKGTLHGKPVVNRDGDPVQNIYKFIKRGRLAKDDEGNNVQLPTTGAVRRMVLPNNYKLTPVPGKPIVVSPQLRQLVSKMAQATDKEQKEQILSQINRAALSGTPDDKIYARYSSSYKLQINPEDGTIRAQNTRRVSKKDTQQPWCWAMTDQNGSLFFKYRKESKVQDIPVYLPGIVDATKPNNPLAAGGWDASQPNAPEVRPMRDREKEARSIHGYKDPVTGKTFDGWIGKMEDAARNGVTKGLYEVLHDKLKKQVDQFGRTGEEHATYLALRDAQGDIAQNAFLYFQYNMANSKALDFSQNNTGRLDIQYIKKTFPHLYAACEQFNQWLDQKTDGIKTNREYVNMRPGGKIWDLTFTQLAKVLDLLEQHTEIPGQGYGTLFQTKINKDYIKNGLKDFTAQNYHKPTTAANWAWQAAKKAEDPNWQPEVDPQAPKTRSHYNAAGKKIDYGYIDVTVESLRELFDEARRNYWEFAAKDMVIKTWQYMNAHGGNNLGGLYGDSIDAALSGRSGSGGKRRKGKGGSNQDTDAGEVGNDANAGEPEGAENGPTRVSLAGDESKGIRHRIFQDMTPAKLNQYLEERRKQIDNMAQQLAQTSNGSIDNAAQQLALIPASKKNAIELDVIDELNKEIKEKGLNAENKQVNDWFMQEFQKRVIDKLTQARDARPAKAETPPVEVPAERTPEEYLKTAKEEGLNTAPEWAGFATELVGKPSDMEEFMTRFTEAISRLPDSKSKEDAQRTVTYFVVKSLMERSSLMTPSDKRKYINISKMISSEYSTLYDLADLIPKVLANVPDEPAMAAAPTAPTGNSLAGRLKRRTA